MAIKIQFDNQYSAITPTFVLGTRSGRKIGALPAYNIKMTENFNSKLELQFEVNKFNNGRKFELWDKIINFATVWCKEWDVWFEITVETKDSDGINKQISCVSIGEAELSQVYLYNVEINTETDISRENYVPTHLYDAQDINASLLNRVLSKVPNYSIRHVDNRIASIQRTFKFDNKSIYDALQDISKEIDCLFVINSGTDDNGKIQRSISVYDLESYCINCHKRGMFDRVCSECGSENTIQGYGEDTAIFISSENLADEITLMADTGSVKNCFRLECGDDLMTATVRSCNPNGSQYIWCIPNTTKSDMSDNLVEKLDAYDMQYNYYDKNYVATFSQNSVVEYNALIEKYDSSHTTYSGISSVTGYSSLMNAYYNTIQFKLYLWDEMMPAASSPDVTAQTELTKILNGLSVVAVENISTCSNTIATSAVISVAKTLIDSAYKIEVSDTSYNSETNSWHGKFTITSYSDDTQIATSASYINVLITDNYSEYIKQRVNNVIKKESDSKNIGIEDLFKLNVNIDDFKNELKKYCLVRLTDFHDSCEACINFLIDQGVADSEAWGTNGESNIYEQIYKPYYDRLIAIEEEIKLRELEINIVRSIQKDIEDQKSIIQSELNFESYLGTDLWLEFIAYRREDTYKNENYISDGLTDAELFDRAQEFIESAKDEIYKSATQQYSLSASLKNLLVIKEFKPIVNKFCIGNWIRIKIDGHIYKLRLISYSIDFNNIEQMSVTFSDVKQYIDGITDIASILSKAVSMSSTYQGVIRQANSGQQSKETLTEWNQNGLSLSEVKIINDADNQNMVYDRHGLLFREYDIIADKYGDKQLKIINKGLYLTDDNWETSKVAVGNYQYLDPETQKVKNVYGVNGEVIVGKLLLGESLGLYNDSGSVKFDNNGLKISGSTTNGGQGTISEVAIVPNNELIFKIQKGQDIVLSFNKDTGVLSVDGNINARTLTLDDSVTINASFIRGLSSVATSGNYSDLSGKPIPVDISGKFDNPTNNNAAINGQVLTKQSNGSVWKSASNTIADNSTDLVTSQAVFNYALNRNQGTNNAGSFLYISGNGEVTPITVSDMKNLLGI